jgi:lipopolysaccharide transport system permease protein
VQTYKLTTVFQHRDLLLAWTIRTIRARYQQSILGALWAVFQPAATVAIFTIVFSYFVRVDTGGIPYVVFSFTAMVPWTLFSTSVNDMVESIVTNMNLVGKIYFPREILVFAAMLARLLDFIIAFSFLIILMIAFRIPVFQISWLLLFPILVIQLLLALGLGLLGGALNVFYRDIRHFVALGLQLWLYATPIIYPVTLVPDQFRGLYFLNPMAGAIEGYRAILFGGMMPGDYLWISTIVAIVLFIFGFWFFKRVEYRFADVI